MELIKKWYLPIAILLVGIVVGEFSKPIVGIARYVISRRSSDSTTVSYRAKAEELCRMYPSEPVCQDFTKDPPEAEVADVMACFVDSSGAHPVGVGDTICLPGPPLSRPSSKLTNLEKKFSKSMRDILLDPVIAGGAKEITPETLSVFINEMHKGYRKFSMFMNDDEYKKEEEVFAEADKEFADGLGWLNQSTPSPDKIPPEVYKRNLNEGKRIVGLSLGLIQQALAIAGSKNQALHKQFADKCASWRAKPYIPEYCNKLGKQAESAL